MTKTTHERTTALALANGFKLKTQPDGTEALNPYVFDFARALLADKDVEIATLKTELAHVRRVAAFADARYLRINELRAAKDAEIAALKAEMLDQRTNGNLTLVPANQLRAMQDEIAALKAALASQPFEQIKDGSVRLTLEMGAHWPDVETDALVVRHVKELTRMLNAERAATQALRDQVSRAVMTGTPDFRRHYDVELLKVIGAEFFQDLCAAVKPCRAVAPSMTVAFDEGVKEPRIVSWNTHSTGTYWLYSAPQTTAHAVRDLLDRSHKNESLPTTKPMTQIEIDTMIDNFPAHSWDTGELIVRAVVQPENQTEELK